MSLRRRPAVTIAIDEKTRAKLEWVAGTRGQSAHAWAKALLVAALADCEDPPPGWGVRRKEEQD